MRFGAIVMLLTSVISQTVAAQQWQTVLSVDSRVGYSTNTYLNPYVSEWDGATQTGYGTISALGQTSWFDAGNMVEFTGGLVYEPFLGSRSSWSGGLALLNYRRNLTKNISGGIESGASYFGSEFNRTLLWAQPMLNWSPSLYTNVKVKAGSSYRQYNNYPIDSTSVDSRSRIDHYALEVETWPSFRWQLKGGLYGSLETLPAIADGFSAVANATHIFSGGEQLGFSFGLEQYRNQFITTTSTGGGGGFPPVGGAPGTTTETVEQTNRMFRIGIDSKFPLNEQFSLFMNVEGLRYIAGGRSSKIYDIQVSGGVRFSIEPSLLKRKSGIEPEWNIKPRQQRLVIPYTGEGQLYLVGDFNNWSRPGIPLVEHREGEFVAQLELSTGAYEYKILTVEKGQDEWLSFSEDVYTVSDGYGGENAMLFIEQQN